MRIPTSVIVMSLLTAAPFAMAIRDTVNEKPRSDGDDVLGFSSGARGDRARREAEAEYEELMHREAEEEATAQRVRLDRLGSLYAVGAPARMGRLFDGIELGANAGNFQPEEARERIAAATSDAFLHVSFDVDATILRGVTIEIADEPLTSSRDACDVLLDLVVSGWGRAVDNVWFAPARGHRASLEVEDRCALTYDRYVEPAAWVAALPLDAIGKRADGFVASLATVVDADESGVEWHEPGTGRGRGVTRYEASVARGKITDVTAAVTTDFDTALAIRRAISARVKRQPKYDADTETWMWKVKPPIELSSDDVDQVTVTIGMTYE